MRKLHRTSVLSVVVAVMVTGMALGVAVGTTVGAAEDGEDSSTEAANFEVTNVETNAPVTAGAKLEVTVEVTNTGGQAANKEVGFGMDNHPKDDEYVHLGPGESDTVSLEYVTKSENAGEWTLWVETPDDANERTITVEEPPSERDSEDDGDARTGSSTGQHPNFEIVDTEVHGPITAGETLRTNVTVENTGGALGEKLVWITLDGETVERAIVEIREGEERTVTLTHNTSVEAAGSRNLSANTSDDVVRESIEIAEAESDYRIRSIETADSVRAGETLTVTVDVENVGDIAEQTPVELAVDGYFIDDKPVELAPNESTSVELQYRTNEEFTGELNLNVSTDDSHEAHVVTVSEPTPTETETATDAETTSTPESSEAAAEQAASTVDGTPAGADGPRGSMPGIGVSVAIATLLAGAVVATRWG